MALFEPRHQLSFQLETDNYFEYTLEARPLIIMAILTMARGAAA